MAEPMSDEQWVRGFFDLDPELQRLQARQAMDDRAALAGLRAELAAEKERAASWQVAAEFSARYHDEAVAQRDKARRDAETLLKQRDHWVAAHQRLVEEAEQNRAAVKRVRELCARGPGPSNEYQIWTVDVLAALDSERAREEGEPRA